MPAIQPENLRRQIDDLLGLALEPGRFIRSCMNLLDYYADRTKRPRGSTTKVEIARILRVPRPVMKTLNLRIQEFEGGEAERWLEIGRGLWNQAIREPRHIAACALAKSPEALIAAEVETWAIACEDDVALSDLTSIGLKQWRKRQPARFYACVAAWLADPRVRIRHMAILALHARSGDDDFDDLPLLLGYLAGISAQVRGSSQHSLTELVRHLASISPPEVAKFLMNEVQADVQGARRLVQSASTAFPQRYQSDLRETLG
ncbi:MAG: DNA alkylation repair protein [Anaerolineales bacterium]|nr:DNA alkylation repair protein [Anaerolineales bacterium]